MSDTERTFVVASDEALVELIARARRRLVVIAPALTQSVAEAVARRLKELDQLDVTIVLDSDPEVYRLGFGETAALEVIRSASVENLFDLRQQPGIRIGVVISDETTLIYTPVSRNIEAGSISTDKPNAIILSGESAGRIAMAAGAERSDHASAQEIGNAALEPAKVQNMQAELKANPARPFDITRKLNVFTSKVQYVEFNALNYRLTTKQIALPPELIVVADDDLRNRITSKIRPPFDGVSKVEVTVEYGATKETLKIDDHWLNKERKRIEDEYTFVIPNFGRVILYSDRDVFEKAAERFRLIVEKYQTSLRDVLLAKQSEFQKRIVDEFSAKWAQTPPKHFARWGIEPSRENIQAELCKLATDIFEEAVTFNPPIVKKLYKNVAPENIQDAAFLDALRKIMIKRRVPREVIDSLFESGHAAPETGSFLGR